MSKVIGLTGGIASGKSTVSSYLINKGYKVIDADKIVHNAYLKDSPTYNEIIKHFNVLTHGEIDRKKLGDIIFNNQEKKKLLENIIHPYVYKEIKKEIDTNKDILFLDIPLLYETHYDKLCDKVIVVYVTRDIQIERLMKRNNLSYDEAIIRIDNQMSLDKKKDLANIIIDNNKGIKELKREIERVLKYV